MRGYDRNEMYRTDDLDEYETDGEEEEVEEEYEEEQEDPKPTEEVLGFLEVRQKMKEAIRKQMKKENGVSFGNSQVKKNKVPYDNYGSFFGPSQPVIAPRVIQESKSLLENQHLAARISNPSNAIRKTPASTKSETRAGVREPAPKVTHELQAKMKAQKLKDNRDYSFLLSEDAEIPAPRKEPSSRPVVTSNSDARSAQMQPKGRQSVSNYHRSISSAREERKPVPTNRQTQTKPAHHQVASGSRRPNMTSADTRKQLASSNGNGPGRPVGQKGLPSKMPALTKPPVSNKSSSLTMNKKPPFSGTKKPVAGSQKPPLSKSHSSVQRQHIEQRRDVREPEKTKLNSKMSAASSKPQSNPPKKMIQPRPPLQADRPKKRPARPFEDDDEDDPMAAIRRMFRYDPKKFAGEDEDDSDMEANFEDILREERRSAKIAKEEDERELRLIEEEEERERMRKEAKRRKLSQR